jgi:hypothetical protein
MPSPNLHPGISKIIQKKMAQSVRNNTRKNRQKHNTFTHNYRNLPQKFIMAKNKSTELDLLEELNETRNLFEHIEARLYKEFPPQSQKWSKKRIELMSGYESVLFHLIEIETALNLPITIDKYNQNSITNRVLYGNTKKNSSTSLSKSRRKKGSRFTNV